MKSKKVFARYAKNILRLKKCKLTILHLGTKADTQQKIIVSSYAKTTIEENREYKIFNERSLIYGKISIERIRCNCVIAGNGLRTYRQRGALPSASGITGGLDDFGQRIYDRQKHRYTE